MIPCSTHNHFSLAIVAHPEQLFVPDVHLHALSGCTVLHPPAGLASRLRMLSRSQHVYMNGNAYTNFFAMFQRFYLL